jgi:hypothetical protein
MPIHLLPSTRTVTPEELRAAIRVGRVLACDFHVEGIERGEELPWGFRSGDIETVDHHAPVPRFTRIVSSTNLALIRIARAGTTEAGETIAVNHTDCDSVLAAAIVSGLLPPDPSFGDSALAADHTGAEDPVADLLQALDSRRDFDLSLRNLRLHLEGKPLDPGVGEARDGRRRAREEARRAVESGAFRRIGAVALGVFQDRVDGEFFPALLPGCEVIVLAYPRPEDPSAWIMKVRLGGAAPGGLSLQSLRIEAFDPAYGGRWNAGGNKRAGGCRIPPERYAAEIAARLCSAPLRRAPR